MALRLIAILFLALPLTAQHATLTLVVLTPTQSEPILGPGAKLYTIANSTWENHTPFDIVVDKSRAIREAAKFEIPVVSDSDASQGIRQRMKFEKWTRTSRRLNAIKAPLAVGIGLLTGSWEAGVGTASAAEWFGREVSNLSKLAPDAAANVESIVAVNTLTIAPGRSAMMRLFVTAEWVNLILTTPEGGRQLTQITDLPASSFGQLQAPTVEPSAPPTIPSIGIPWEEFNPVSPPAPIRLAARNVAWEPLWRAPAGCYYRPTASGYERLCIK